MSDRFCRVCALLLILVPATLFAQDLKYRFNIPQGSLRATLSAFEATTGLRVSVIDGVVLADFQSPGASGELEAGAALEALLAGTGLSARRESTGFTIRIAAAPVRVDVEGRYTPYRSLEATAATKIATPLRDIPQTITVVPIELLRDQRAQSVGDAMRNVPGVTVAQGEGNRDQIVLRGISTNSDFFVNGIRDDQERFRDLYNVEAVEVVQGPAAVLFGRGGAGGVVNLVTQRPARGMRPEAAVELGAYGHKRATVQFGLPVGRTGAFALAVVGQDSGGFRDGFFLRRYGFNPTFAFSLGSRTKVTLGAEHFSDHRLADRGIPSRNGAPVDVPATQLFGSRNQNDAQSGVDSVRATVEHRVSPALVVRNSFLAGRYDKFYANVYPGSAVSPAGTFSLAAYDHSIDRVNVFNQTDVIYDTSLFGLTHTVLGGVEIGRQMQDELRHTATAIAGVTLSTSERDASLGSAPLAVDRRATGNIFASYVQDQVTVSKGVKAVVGARLDRFGVTVDDHIAGNPDLSRTDFALSPRAGVVVQPSSTTSLYASYSYTFIPSGERLGLARNTAEVEPENAKNYETGAKLELLDRRLSLTAAIFRLDRNNVKNTDPNDPTRLVLTGQQRTEGVQLSASGNLSPRWKISGGYANLFARVTEDTASAPAGRRVGLVPRHQGTLWTTYDLTDRIGAGAGVIRQSRMFTSFTNQVTLSGFTRVDALAYYRVGRYRLSMNVENLFNRRYYPTANGDNNISPGAPRNVQFSVRATF